VARAISAALTSVLLGGCASMVPLRTADVMEPGEGRIVVQSTFVLEPGGSISSESGARTQVTAFGGAGTTLDGILLALASLELQAGLGASEDCEVGFVLGLAWRVGAELRCAALDEDDGDALSLALSLQAGIRLVLWHPWIRAGVESGGRASDTVAPFGAIYGSWGRHWHAWEPGLFGGDIIRDEIRVHALAGLALAPAGWTAGAPDPNASIGAALAGVTMWWSPHAWLGELEPPGIFTVSSPETERRRLHREWGGAVLLGGAYQSASSP